MEFKIKPIARHCLVKTIKRNEERTKGGIILSVNENKNIVEGEVLAIGNKLEEEKETFDKDLHVGTKVLFDRSAIIYSGIKDDQNLIPFNAIVAILDGHNSQESDGKSFFEIEKWESFAGKNYSDWEQYSNFRDFRIFTTFLQPFSSLDQLSKFSHEYIFKSVSDIPELVPARVKIGATKEKDSYRTIIEDDVWNAEYTTSLDEEGFDFTFVKNNTDIKSMHKTLPKLLNVYADIMRSNVFRKFAGNDFSRAKRFVLGFTQSIRLEGKGLSKKPIKNSEIMRQFLKLQTVSDSDKKSVLETLAFAQDDIGRIDFKLSFTKEIVGNQYDVFMDIKAPANDENSLINITWNIVDNNPGYVPDKKLGPILTKFLRDIIFQSFYNRWFKENEDIQVSTIKI